MRRARYEEYEDPRRYQSRRIKADKAYEELGKSAKKAGPKRADQRKMAVKKASSGKRRADFADYEDEKDFKKKKNKIRKWDRIFAELCLACLIVCGFMVYNDQTEAITSLINTAKNKLGIEKVSVFSASGSSETKSKYVKVAGNFTDERAGTEFKFSDVDTSVTIVDHVLDGKVICIDPGHGTGDPGIVVGKYSEKDITYKVAGLLKKELESHGASVLITRTDKLNPTSEERAQKANQASSDICISLRMNSADATVKVSGAEAFVANAADKEASRLANDLLTGINTDSSIKNRGVKTGTISDPKKEYDMNSKTNAVSCVVFMGFMSDKTELALFTDKCESVSKGLADGVINYYKGI